MEGGEQSLVPEMQGLTGTHMIVPADSLRDETSIAMP